MALYHSARGSVGYTIVGTPTIVNGVAKDFSLDNYLSLNSTITSFTELSISFIPGTYSSGRIVLFKTGVNAYRGSLNWAANSTARFTYTNTSNDAGNLTNIPYTEGKENILKIEYVSTNSVKLTLSRQGESNFIRTITDIDIPATFGGDIYFGRGTSDYSSFNGSIDLNKTYIIDNGQPFFGICPIEVKKHQIMGPVGYTVVGSPTITDGVASGFSSSNYATVAKFDFNNDFEFNVAFTKTASGNGGLLIGNDYYYGGLEIVSNKMRFAARESDGTTNYFLTGTNTIDLNTPYVANVTRTGNSIVMKVYKNGTLDETITNDITGISFSTNIKVIRIGQGADGVFNGSIDLNSTYIKINGKLWFYQPQATKYIIRNGKLVWADPKLYLVNSGRAYINTGVPSNAVTNYKIDYRITDSSIRIMAFGADVSFRNKSDIFIGIANSGLYWYYGTGDSAYHVLLSQSSEYYLQKNRLEVNYSSTSATGSIYNNTEQISSYTTTASELSSNTYYLFGLNHNGTATLDGSLRIYSAQYYGSNINKYLVPVPQGLQIGSFTVPSNGMFDIVNQQFYGNQGAGQFIIGRDE